MTEESEFLSITADSWLAITALAAAGTFMVAAAAAIIAFRQLRASNQLRLDQSRPYVMVTLEPSPTAFSTVDFFVRNAGAGPARDVRITVSPPLQRAREVDGMPLGEVRYFNEPIPIMPPGYEFRSHFDSMIERNDRDPKLPERYTFTISYDDGHGHSWTETSVQDLGLLNDMLFTEHYGIHDLAKAAREVNQLLSKSQLIKNGHAEVTIETRPERRARLKDEFEQRQAQMQGMRQKLVDQQAPPPEEQQPEPTPAEE